MRILITAGPTREFFDTVRFISNPSTGKMGYALAAAAKSRGHQVILVTGPVALAAPRGIEVVSVVSAAEMAAACKGVWPDCDAGILTAAVCDYRPRYTLDHKLKKKAMPRHVTLAPTEDIAATLGRTKEHRPVVGFAMEDHDHYAHAEAKLRRKRCDAMVLNGPENVGADRARIQILTRDGKWSRPIIGSKRTVAGRIVRLVETLAARGAMKTGSGRGPAGRKRKGTSRRV